MRVIGVVALSLVVATAASAASARPALRVTARTPFTVHGWRFEPSLHVRLVISTKGRHVRRLTTSTRGTFTLKTRLSMGACQQYAVVAYGPSGARLASIKSTPQSCGANP
jgi:hypothetical protein